MGGPNGGPGQTFEPGGLVNYGPLQTVIIPGEAMVSTPGGTKRQPVVFLRAETPVGMIVLTFDPTHAEKLSADLARCAKEVKTGLTVVKGGIVSPDAPKSS